MGLIMFQNAFFGYFVLPYLKSIWENGGRVEHFFRKGL
jgi:hypothetical protein